MSAEAAAIARRAAEIVQERGLHKGGLSNYETGSVCLMGAVFASIRECRAGVFDASLSNTVLLEAAGVVLAMHPGEFVTAVDFNDQPETDERDIAKVLLQTADRLDVAP